MTQPDIVSRTAWDTEEKPSCPVCPSPVATLNQLPQLSLNPSSNLQLVSQTSQSLPLLQLCTIITPESLESQDWEEAGTQQHQVRGARWAWAFPDKPISEKLRGVPVTISYFSGKTNWI